MHLLVSVCGTHLKTIALITVMTVAASVITATHRPDDGSSK
jgi:hypothetical protein